MDQTTPVSVGTEMIYARDLSPYTVLAIYPDGRLYVQRTLVTTLGPEWFSRQMIAGSWVYVELSPTTARAGSIIRHASWKGAFVVVASPEHNADFTVMQSHIVDDRSDWSLAYPTPVPGTLA